VRLKTIGALQDAVDYAYLDDQLFEYLLAPDSRQKLIGALVTEWFPDRMAELAQLMKVDHFGQITESYRQEGGKLYAPEVAEDEARLVVHDAAFRRTFVSIYDYRCALCELKALDYLNRHIVDRAHIRPFSEFYDDQVSNGLCLCKNHHWAFDRGWLSIDDGYHAIVSGHVKEDSRSGTTLADYHGHPISVPDEECYIPRKEALSWHRGNRFIG